VHHRELARPQIDLVMYGDDAEWQDLEKSLRHVFKPV
jgi:hypothetical protein